jgi:pSer/pThr/pTyr-binding forkhead associated (FHA) protein
MSKLIVRAGNDDGYEFALRDGPMVIGRGTDAAVCLIDKKCSRHHCRLAKLPGHYTLEDLGSRNGTFINDRQIHGAEPVKAGDRIRVGNTVMELSNAALDESRSAPSPGEREARMNCQQHTHSLTEEDTAQATPGGGGLMGTLRRLFRRG